MCVGSLSKICLAVCCLSFVYSSNSMNFELDSFMGRGGEYKKSYTAEDDINYIENSKFEGMKDLEIVELLGLIKKIGCRSFAGTGVNKFRLKEGLIEICDEAFANCTNLDSINFPNSIKILGENVLNHSTVSEIFFPGSWKIFKQRLERNDFGYYDFEQLSLYVDIGNGKNIPLGFVPCATKLWQNGKLLSIEDLPRVPEDFGEKSPLQELYGD